MPQCRNCNQEFIAYQAPQPAYHTGRGAMRWNYCLNCVIGSGQQNPDSDIPGSRGGQPTRAPSPPRAVSPSMPPVPPVPAAQPIFDMRMNSPLCLQGMACPLCLENLVEPLGILGCGHMFDYPHIEEHLQSTYGGTTKYCPVCRAPFNVIYTLDMYSTEDQERVRVALRGVAGTTSPTALSGTSGSGIDAGAASADGNPHAIPSPHASAEPDAQPGAWSPINRGDASWHPDRANCENCGGRFYPPFNRRHHCRKCGKCICGRCSRNEDSPHGPLLVCRNGCVPARFR